MSAILSVSPEADVLSEAKQAIKTGYGLIDKAYIASDFDKIGSFFDPSCKIRREGEPGAMTATIFLNVSRGMASSRKVISSATLVKAVKETSDGYVATALWTWVTKDPSPASKRSQPIKARQTVVDTWRKVDGRWVVVKRAIRE